MNRDVEVARGKNLKREEESTLFLQMNYCRHKMNLVQRHLERAAVWTDLKLEELFLWYRKQLQVRNKIVGCNMGLLSPSIWLLLSYSYNSANF